MRHAIPRFQVVLGGGEVFGAYMTIDDAKEAIRRLAKKGIVAKVIERLRVW